MLCTEPGKVKPCQSTQAQIQSGGKAAGTLHHPKPSKARGTVPAQLTAVSWQLKAGLGSRNKAVSSRLAVVVPRIILV